MRICGRLLFVLFLAFGFQGGIVTSAASGIKLGDLKTLCVTQPVDPAAGVEGIAPETPWPSCKSMAAPFDAEFAPPVLEAGVAGKGTPDHARGLWRTLPIDEPPKDVLTPG